MASDIAIVVRRDLRLVWRSKTVQTQLIPLAIMMIVMFAFAFDNDTGSLRRATAGVVGIGVLTLLLLATQQAVAVESHEGLRDAVALSCLSAGSLFLGKSFALAIQLGILTTTLWMSAALLYGSVWEKMGTQEWVAAALLSVVTVFALSFAGALLGIIAAGVHTKETLLPMLLFPMTAPVLLSMTQGFRSILVGSANQSYPWTGLVALAGVIFGVVGWLAYESLMEDT